VVRFVIEAPNAQSRTQMPLCRDGGGGGGRENLMVSVSVTVALTPTALRQQAAPTPKDRRIRGAGGSDEAARVQRILLAIGSGRAGWVNLPFSSTFAVALRRGRRVDWSARFAAPPPPPISLWPQPVRA